METVCQACGYQRKPADQAPDWQCPACGRAYAKTSHESPSPLVIYPDGPSPAAATVSGLHGGPSYRVEPKETTLNKYGLLMGTLFALFLSFGIPILVNPSSASAILLHSNAGFVSLTFIALMAVVAVGRRMSTGVDANDRKSVFVFGGTIFGLMLGVMFLAFAMSGQSDARDQIRIQRNGLRTVADVVRIYNGGCGRRSCSFYVEYAFTPSAEAGVAAKPIHGYADIGNHSIDPRVVYARANKQVPIAYEVGHPEVSALNFDDDVFRLDHHQQSNGTLALLAKLFLGIFAVVLAIVGLSLWLRPGAASNVS